MSDTIGRIPVPALVDSGLTFPLAPDFGYGFTQDRPVVVHQFGELDAKAEQRYAVGIGPRKFAFRRQRLSMRDRATLISFWESLQGAWKSFTYNVPNPDQSTTPTKATWEYAPLTVQYLANAAQAGFNFIEVPDPAAAPSYAVNSTCLRFPSAALQSALLSRSSRSSRSSTSECASRRCPISICRTAVSPSAASSICRACSASANRARTSSSARTSKAPPPTSSSSSATPIE